MSANFIKMISELQFQRFNVYLGDLVIDKVPFGIFFGYEVIPKEVKHWVQSFQNTGLNVTCICVIANTPTIANGLQNIGVPVVSLDEFSSFGKNNFRTIKPQVIYIPDVIKDLAFVPYFSRYGIESISLLNINTSEKYFFFMMSNLPKLYEVYSMFDDEESKKVYRAVIKGRLTGKLSDYHFAPEPQYFLEGFYPNEGDIVIDGGSFDGGTSAAFAKCGAQVYAFEMDAENYKNCLPRAEKFGFTIENMGLSDKESEENYNHDANNPAGSKKTGGGMNIAKFIDLDTYAQRKDIPRVDYIKLDIEGAELDMLHGAAETIKKFKPKMAVSAYHKPEDMWTLATYIKTLRPDYEFKFRHYGIDFTDYDMDDTERAILDYFNLSYIAPNHGEYVLYCR